SSKVPKGRSGWPRLGSKEHRTEPAVFYWELPLICSRFLFVFFRIGRLVYAVYDEIEITHSGEFEFDPSISLPRELVMSRIDRPVFAETPGGDFTRRHSGANERGLHGRRAIL